MLRVSHTPTEQMDRSQRWKCKRSKLSCLLLFLWGHLVLKVHRYPKITRRSSVIVTASQILQLWLLEPTFSPRGPTWPSGPGNPGRPGGPVSPGKPRSPLEQRQIHNHITLAIVAYFCTLLYATSPNFGLTFSFRVCKHTLSVKVFRMIMSCFY